MSRPSPLSKSRCSCSTCGAHTAGLVGRALVSGICGCCGGKDLVPIGPLQPLGDGLLRELGGGRLL